MTELSELLVDYFAPRPVTPGIRSRREHLCEFIRAHESRAYDVSHPRAGTVRTLLGWDDETMTAFIASPLLCHSSPHAGMNAFPPTFAYVWILSRAIRLAQERYREPAVHLRTQCTHHNFDDTFAKPHAWWHRGPDGGVLKTPLFARGSVKHHPILSKPAPVIRHESLHPVDREAVELAEIGTNYAYYCLIYRAVLERTMGFHVPHRTLELPIDLLNRFTIGETGLLPWFDAMADANQALRLEKDNAPMASLARADAEVLARAGTPWLERAVIAPNRVNIAQFYRLGLSLMIGGPKMAVYVPEMNEWIASFASDIASWTCESPSFLPVTRVPVIGMLGLEQEAEYCQREWGISTSLSLAASVCGGQATERLEPMLTMDYAHLFDQDLARQGAE